VGQSEISDPSIFFSYINCLSETPENNLDNHRNHPDKLQQEPGNLHQDSENDLHDPENLRKDRD
jgi:hypothetical protein